MSAKMVRFSQEAREKSPAWGQCFWPTRLAVTLGPKGRNVVIREELRRPHGD